MVFEDDFFDLLPEDTNLAAKILCEKYLEFDSGNLTPYKNELFLEYMYSFLALEAFVSSREIDFKLPELKGEKNHQIDVIRGCFVSFFSEIKHKIEADNIEQTRERYKNILQKGFVYKFTDGDLERIQKLINELRDLISSSELFDAKHKFRLLDKLENLQRNLHKKVSSLDKFWGLVGDAGVAIGKFGKDAKPFVERMREIAEIVWRTQANAEELPSGTRIPLLDSNKEE